MRSAAAQGWAYFPPSWGQREAEKARERREAQKARKLELELAEAERRHADARKAIGRPPKKLPLNAVLKAERELRRRQALPANPRSGPLTYSAIAERTKLNRNRVTEIEELIAVGWPLRESHPDFPAEDGFVRLPTPREAARLLRSR